MTYKIIGGDGREYGPVTDADLRKWIGEGRINAQTLAKSESDAEFRPLSTFPEFADFFGAATASSASYPTAVTDWGKRDYQLDIGGCISRGWTLFMDNIGILLGCTVLYLVILIAVFAVIGGIIGGLLAHTISPEVMYSATYTIVQDIVVRTLVALIVGPLTGGLYYVFIQTIRGQTAGVGDLFIGFQKAYAQLFLGYLVFSMVGVVCLIPFSIVWASRAGPVLVHLQHSPTPGQLHGLMLDLIGALQATSLVAVLCLIPVIYLVTNLLFALPLIIDQAMDFWTAIKTSWKMVHKHWFAVFGLLLLTGIINIVGVCLCCVGFIFTMAITTAAFMIAYETIFGEPRRD